MKSRSALIEGPTLCPELSMNKSTFAMCMHWRHYFIALDASSCASCRAVNLLRRVTGRCCAWHIGSNCRLAQHCSPAASLQFVPVRVLTVPDVEDTWITADPNDKEFAKEGRPALTGDELINAPGLSFQFLRKASAHAGGGVLPVCLSS
jgi:hypothetical protein